MGNSCHRKVTQVFALWSFVLFTGFATAALAAQFEGEVVGLADGDTLTVLDGNKNQHKVRLAGIDAPEKTQPFGNRSRQHLADLVFRKHVSVEWVKRDRFDRIIGKVLVDGNDAGLAQIRAGLSWHYKAYQKEQSSSDQGAYAAAEDIARSKRIGLWAAANPIPPWEYRRKQPSN